MSMRAHFLALALALSTSVLAGCGHHFVLEAPSDFIALDEGEQARRGYAMRATSADGVVIAVREIANERHGSRDFWVQAIRNRLRRAGGYALLEESEVRAATGETGHQMRFGRDESGRPYAYWLTVFVSDERITLVEAGGRREAFEAQDEPIRRAIERVRLR
ncbi:MAG: serine/threonine protein kinase [Myxococcota bacterium]|nr:serine/threonine protein kinase [Myxococcota bacterium]